MIFPLILVVLGLGALAAYELAPKARQCVDTTPDTRGTYISAPAAKEALARATSDIAKANVELVFARQQLEQWRRHNSQMIGTLQDQALVKELDAIEARLADGQRRADAASAVLARQRR